MNSPPPRVLRLITRLNIGGPARQAIYLDEELGRRGFRTTLATGVVGPREGSFDPRPDGEFVRIPTLRREVDPVRDARAYAAVSGLIGRLRPEIVHTHLAKAGALGRAAALRHETAVIVHTFHGHVLEGYFSAPKRRLFLELERHLAQRSDALIAVSEAVRDELLALGVGTEDRWRIIKVGFDLAPLLALHQGSRRESRIALGLPPGVPVVGIVGRLVPVKDHRSFLRAAVRVSQQRPRVMFAVAGDGDLRTDLENEAARLLGDRCRFLGWVPDLATLYSALDVVVLTSRNEGTPVALIEAGAAARPVVATRVGGVPDVVRDGETGWLVNRGDDEALARAMVRLLDSEDEARSLGEAGRRWVRDRYSAERLADEISALYRELLERKLSAAR